MQSLLYAVKSYDYFIVGSIPTYSFSSLSHSLLREHGDSPIGPSFVLVNEPPVLTFSLYRSQSRRCTESCEWRKGHAAPCGRNRLTTM